MLYRRASAVTTSGASRNSSRKDRRTLVMLDRGIEAVECQEARLKYLAAQVDGCVSCNSRALHETN